MRGLETRLILLMLEERVQIAIRVALRSSWRRDPKRCAIRCDSGRAKCLKCVTVLIEGVEEEEEWWPQALTRIVRPESEHKVPVWPHHDRIPLHWYFWKRLIVDIKSRRLVTSNNCLKSMTMQMERMFARIVVVENYFYYLILLEDKSVSVGAIDCGIGGQGGCGQGCIEGWHFGTDIGRVVKERTAEESVHFLSDRNGERTS